MLSLNKRDRERRDIASAKLSLLTESECILTEYSSSSSSHYADDNSYRSISYRSSGSFNITSVPSEHEMLVEVSQHNIVSVSGAELEDLDSEIVANQYLIRSILSFVNPCVRFCRKY